MNNPDAARAFNAWRLAKDRLRSTMDPRDFQQFVRPMFLLVPLSGSCLLLALPRNKRIVERARHHRKQIAAAIQAEGFNFAGFTAYPSDDELVSLRQWLPFFAGPVRARYEQALRRRAEEDARDRADCAA